MSADAQHLPPNLKNKNKKSVFYTDTDTDKSVFYTDTL